MIYVIEASKDGNKWKEQARFRKGQRSRFNDAPFDETIAIKEAEGFKHFRYSDGWAYVRVVIEV